MHTNTQREAETDIQTEERHTNTDTYIDTHRQR